MNKEKLQDLLDEVCARPISYEEYESIISEFDLYPADAYQKMYYTIGMNGEFDELLYKIQDWEHKELSVKQILDLKNEGGDVCWYLTRLANAFGFSLTGLVNLNDSPGYYDLVLEHIFYYKGKLTETVKKIFRDNNGELNNEYRDRLFTAFDGLFCSLHHLGMLPEHNFTLKDMMRENLIKLLDRKIRDVQHGDGDHR